ncbi:hypothetical protein QL285_062609 [Trifolium repens]|nr:hypothetical protein QL285_062609 [Trifolium repens]
MRRGRVNYSYAIASIYRLYNDVALLPGTGELDGPPKGLNTIWRMKLGLVNIVAVEGSKDTNSFPVKDERGIITQSLSLLLLLEESPEVVPSIPPRGIMEPEGNRHTPHYLRRDHGIMGPRATASLAL